MAGLFRFDFYPRDWISGTRELSDRARGAYIDLLCRMYDLGAPLDNDERELCRFLGYRDHRQLRPVLAELLRKGKLIQVDGKLSNARAMREIGAAADRITTGKKGGRPRNRLAPPPAKAEDEIGTRTAPAGDHEASTSRSHEGCIEQNQSPSAYPSPSPSPSPKIPPTEGAAAPLDPEKPIFDFGKSLLGKSSGGQVKNLIRHHGGDLAATLHTLNIAAGKSDPREYVGAILRGIRQPETDWDAEYRRMGVL